ncbi:MAG: DUF6867 family protein [Pseudolabrys sp.]
MEAFAHFFYEEDSFGIFLLVTLALGGGGAWLTGRAIAGTWRPWWQVAVYMFIFAGVVRFIHFALFGGTLLSLHYYLVDSAVCLAVGFAGYRVMRVNQMVEQYHWLNSRAGRFRWRRHAS